MKEREARYAVAVAAALMLGACGSGSGGACDGLPDQLVFSTQPSTVGVGVALQPAVRVQAIDGCGSLVQTFTGSVQLALQGGPADAALSGATAVNAVAGIATFDPLSVNRVATNYSLITTSGTLTQATSAPFDVVVQGVVAEIAFVVEPTDVNEGDAISPAPMVEALDAAGVRVTSFTGPITIVLRGSDGTSEPPGITTITGGSANAVAGLATFGSIRIGVSGNSNVTLRASTGAFVAVSQVIRVQDD